jgi:hypothetical protein
VAGRAPHEEGRRPQPRGRVGNLHRAGLDPGVVHSGGLTVTLRAPASHRACRRRFEKRQSWWGLHKFVPPGETRTRISELLDNSDQASPLRGARSVLRSLRLVQALVVNADPPGLRGLQMRTAHRVLGRDAQPFASESHLAVQESEVIVEVMVATVRFSVVAKQLDGQAPHRYGTPQGSVLRE